MLSAKALWQETETIQPPEHRDVLQVLLTLHPEMRDFEVLVIKQYCKSLQDQEQQLLRLLPLAVQQDDYWLPAEISQVFLDNS